MAEKKTHWDWEIRPQAPWFGNSFRELFSYKDLLFRLVRKEFLLRYQQTLLGPLWVLLQPLLTVIVYVLVFNRVVRVPIHDVPPFLFYFTGITLWTLFSDIFTSTSNSFLHNVEVFQKVYFPRLIAPLSVMFLHAVRFLIQFTLLFITLLFYQFQGEVASAYGNFLLFLPAAIVTAGIALGGGLIFSIITAKYRDLSNLLNLMVGLLMFVCPIIYPLSEVPEQIKWFVSLNPLSAQFELFRFALLGKGDVTLMQLVYSFSFMLVLLAGGLLLFNKKGDALMDVV